MKPSNNHIRPRYCGYYPHYSGRVNPYWRVNQCQNPDCLLVGISEDLWETRPCPECGSEVKPAGSARWTQKQIGKHPDEFFGLIKGRPIFEGRWEPSKVPQP